MVAPRAKIVGIGRKKKFVVVGIVVRSGEFVGIERTKPEIVVVEADNDGWT